MVAVPLPPQIPAPHAVELRALDGEPLAGCHFAPRRAARGAALIVPAMGVPQAFYAPLATWLAEIGVHALTFDYRGTGRSSRRPLREVEADVVTWARLDTGAALRALQDRVPGAPLTWIGHSLGAQIIPFVPDHRELAQVITIAAGTGYWRDNVAAVRLKAWLMWHVATPLLTPLFGYFPGKRLHMVGDLPAGVTRQWRRWCLDPQYTVGAEGPLVRELYARVTAPITSLSFTDDEIMSERNTESLHAFYVAAPTTMRRIAPQAVGMPRIGHFDFFRPASREPLWEAVLRPELALR
ncbi:MAG TPA: alpha/beta fold hydrolase [Kofleriaceae bacterium]|nr:alpha/beta fold hydrolase [Kofleriaceae bacterium]